MLYPARELIEERRQDKKREILTGIKPGETRRGMVKNITDYGAFIDLDGLDGLLHITDMSWGRISHPSEMVKTGRRNYRLYHRGRPKTRACISWV